MEMEEILFFLVKKIKTLGIDISKQVIENNNLIVNKKKMKFLKFENINIAANKSINRKFDYIYARFLIHAVTYKTEKKLILLIKNIKKKYISFFRI